MASLKNKISDLRLFCERCEVVSAETKSNITDVLDHQEELVKAFKAYVTWCGSMHREDCPAQYPDNGNCICGFGPIEDAVNKTLAESD